MHIGALTIRILALVATGVLAGNLFAQVGGGPSYPPRPNAGGGAQSSRPVQALFLAPIGRGPTTPYVDAHGNPVVVPASYHGDCYADGCAYDGYPAACDGYADGWGYGGSCPGCGGFCNGGLCPNCGAGTQPPFNECVENYSMLPPHRTEQCGPHYFDVRMEAVFLTRDKVFNQDVDFTSLNVDGPIVLSSRQLDFDYAAGFRILGRYDIGPLSVLEFGYTGVESLDSSAFFTDPDPVDADTGNLYSLFTDFVRDPLAVPADVTTPDGSFPFTERSITHSISLETELHTAEMTYRRYWVGFNPAISGTLLAGFRFTRLREDFAFTAFGEATGQYLALAKNDLAGFQTGGDVWVHLRQGLRAGFEGKVGIYNNHYTLENSFATVPASGTPPTFNEQFEKDIPAFITEASVDIVCDVLPSWSIRAGYEILFLNSIVLAGENFNTGTVYTGLPDVLLPERVPFIFDQGNAFYHGFHVGAEYIW